MKRSKEELESIVATAAVEIAIDELIQEEINSYNLSNVVTFKDINAIPKYAIDTNYTHYGFCVSVLAWNMAVWEESRRLQIDITAGTIAQPASIEEFLAMLPQRA